jgi:uncharacterized protein (TIGR04255 family)
LIRCGILPPDTTVDPGLQPADTRSWILDIDSFIDNSSAIEMGKIDIISSRLAERAYRFFRYTMNPEFLERFGVINE